MLGGFFPVCRGSGSRIFWQHFRTTIFASIFAVGLCAGTSAMCSGEVGCVPVRSGGLTRSGQNFQATSSCTYSTLFGVVSTRRLCDRERERDRISIKIWHEQVHRNYNEKSAREQMLSREERCSEDGTRTNVVQRRAMARGRVARLSREERWPEDGSIQMLSREERSCPERGSCPCPERGSCPLRVIYHVLTPLFGY